MADKPPAPAAELDPAIKAVLANLGNGGPQASDDDPPIYLGQTPTAEFSYDTELRSRKPKTADKTTTLSAYNQQFYQLDPAALKNFQQRAAAAGLFGNQKPRFGDYDDETYKVWQSVGMRAARFYAAGQSFTTNDVLDMAIQSTPPEQQQARAYATRTDVVNLQDPATIRQAAHAAFKAVSGKGRPISDDKINKFVEQFTAAQAGSQRAVNRAQDQAEQASRAAQNTIDQGGTPTPGPISQEVDYTAPDLGARAEEYARNADPAQAGAHDIAGKFAMFTKIIGGIV